MKKEIVLKSNSPRRKEILSNNGYKFVVKSTDIDEEILDNLTPYENTKRIALLKASYKKEEDYANFEISGCRRSLQEEAARRKNAIRKTL